MTPHDAIAIVSIVAVAIGGVLGWLASRTIATLDRDLAEARGEIAALRESVHKLDLDTARTGTSLDSQSQRFDRLEGAIERLENKLDRALGLPPTPPHGLPRMAR